MNDLMMPALVRAGLITPRTKELFEGIGVAVNADLTVVCQRPKLSPHKEAMARNIASLLGCDVSQINLKAKTHENVDAIGEGRAIACHGVVLLVKK